jgi:hypothetical protein
MDGWQALLWHKARIEARLAEDGSIEFRSLHNGEPCKLDHVMASILIEDDRMVFSLDMLIDMADHDNGLRAKLWGGNGWDYTKQRLTGAQAQSLITTARRTTTTPERMADLTAVTFDDLLQLIPGEPDYEA